jgi:hypothetical protein
VSEEYEEEENGERNVLDEVGTRKLEGNRIAKNNEVDVGTGTHEFRRGVARHNKYPGVCSIWGGRPQVDHTCFRRCPGRAIKICVVFGPRQVKGMKNQTETIKCDAPFDLERVRWKENQVDERRGVAMKKK